MYSVCFAKHVLECGVIVLHVLEEPLLGELWGVGLDISLLEVVGVGLITCEGVGVVKRVHTLLGEVHRLATALKEMQEVQEEVQEMKDEWEDEEVEGNGDQGRGRTAHFMRDEMTCATPFSHAVQCES